MNLAQLIDPERVLVERNRVGPAQVTTRTHTEDMTIRTEDRAATSQSGSGARRPPIKTSLAVLTILDRDESGVSSGELGRRTQLGIQPVSTTLHNLRVAGAVRREGESHHYKYFITQKGRWWLKS